MTECTTECTGFRRWMFQDSVAGCRSAQRSKSGPQTAKSVFFFHLYFGLHMCVLPFVVLPCASNRTLKWGVDFFVSLDRVADSEGGGDPGGHLCTVLLLFCGCAGRTWVGWCGCLCHSSINRNGGIFAHVPLPSAVIRRRIAGPRLSAKNLLLDRPVDAKAQVCLCSSRLGALFMGGLVSAS